MRSPSLLLVPILIGACGHGGSATVDEDDSALVEGDVVFANDPTLWAMSSYEDFRAWHDGSGISGGGEVMPADSAVTKRLQVWVDRIDGVVRAAFRAKTGTDLVAPKPTIRVLVNDDPNAWVSSVPVCLSRPIAGAQPDAFCVKPTNMSVPDEQILEAANATLVGIGCRFVLRDDKYVLESIEGQTCAIEDPNEVASDASIPVTSPYIHATTSLLSRIGSEQEIVAVLAHELGHYYRAHPSARSMFNPYWYQQTEQLSVERPKPIADNDALLSEWAKSGENVGAPTVKGQQLDRMLVESILSLGRYVGAVATTWTQNACADVSREVEQPWVGGPLDAHNAAYAAGYLRLERALLACGERIALVRRTESSPPSASPRDGALWADQTLQLVDSRLVDVASTPDTLADLIFQSEGKAHSLSLRGKLLGETATRRKLGFYTVEEEADDFSLEWASKAGLVPGEIIDRHAKTIAALYKESPASFDLEGIDWPKCQSLYRAHFKGTDGHTQFVPLGLLHEPHHSYCYRLFNMVRGQDAHKFKAARLPALPSVDWSAMRREAKSFQEAHPIPPPAPVPDVVPADADGGAPADAGANARNPRSRRPRSPRIVLRGGPIVDRW